jgi:hypothetical protein
VNLFVCRVRVRSSTRPWKLFTQLIVSFGATVIVVISYIVFEVLLWKNIRQNIFLWNSIILVRLNRAFFFFYSQILKAISIVYYAFVIVFLACRTLWDVHKMKKSIGDIGTANQLSKRDKQLRRLAFHVIIVAVAAVFGTVIGVATDSLWTNTFYVRWLRDCFIGAIILF